MPPLRHKTRQGRWQGGCGLAAGPQDAWVLDMWGSSGAGLRQGRVGRLIPAASWGGGSPPFLFTRAITDGAVGGRLIPSELDKEVNVIFFKIPK